ncbi:putative LOC107375531-like protein [Nothobranchius furzeri]|uniref:LOC107375531-like protein n=1 Tax=Nothobranchius furzeri TaxID=105023 RepID=A0A9D2YFU6_NOTFU|nr:putative LOC107375531-like protein [Nothobranchius furzeri]
MPVSYQKANLSETNTFQCILTTDGVRSFALLRYGEMNWGPGLRQYHDALIGYTDGTFSVKETPVPPDNLFGPGGRYRPQGAKGTLGNLGQLVYNLTGQGHSSTDPGSGCRAWWMKEPSPLEWMVGVSSCPCTLNQAVEDLSFIQDTTDPGPTVQKLRDQQWGGAKVYIFKSILSNKYGAGKTCAYETEGALLAGIPGRYFDAISVQKHIGKDSSCFVLSYHKNAFHSDSNSPNLSLQTRTFFHFSGAVLSLLCVGFTTRRDQRITVRILVQVASAAPLLLCFPGREFRELVRNPCEQELEKRHLLLQLHDLCGMIAAMVYGSLHFITFDGTKYSFQALGEFVLLRLSSASGSNIFTLQGLLGKLLTASKEVIDVPVVVRMAAFHQGTGKIEWRCSSDTNGALRMFVDDVEVPVKIGVVYTSEKNFVVRCISVSRCAAVYASGLHVVTWLNVDYCQMGAMVEVSQNFYNRTVGLMGFWSSNRIDDFLLSDGRVFPSQDLNPPTEEKLQDFGLSWSVPVPESLLLSSPPKAPQALTTTKATLERFSPAVVAEQMKACKDSVQCVYDSLASGIADLGQQTLDAEAQFQTLAQIYGKRFYFYFHRTLRKIIDR